MHPVVIDRTIRYGDVRILVARDDAQRSFVALNTGVRQQGRFVFLQVEPSTIDELEALSVDLHTLVTRRCTGLIFTAERDEVLRAPGMSRQGFARPMPPPRAAAAFHPGRPG